MTPYYSLINWTTADQIIENDFFPFNEGEGIVKIVPMRTLFCERVLTRLKKNYGGYVKPLKCYSNALIVAEYLKTQGFDIDVVEGYYSPSPSLSDEEYRKAFPFSFAKEGRDTHRFCKKGDYYFDPTLELTIGYNNAVKYYQHISTREYNTETLWAYSIAVGGDLGQDIKFCSSIDGISYSGGCLDIPSYHRYINNSYHLVGDNCLLDEDDFLS